MVSYNLRIGSHLARVIPIVLKMPKLDDVDEEGNKVKKLQIQQSEYKWIRVKDKKEVRKVYKSYNGKVFRKLAKTTEINKTEKITKEKALDLNTEKSYLVVSDTLAKSLKPDEALSFLYSNGNGFKVYHTAIYKEGTHLIMVCGLGFKTDLIKKLDVSTGITKEIDETVDRATVNDMVAVVGVA